MTWIDFPNPPMNAAFKKRRDEASKKRLDNVTGRLRVIPLLLANGQEPANVMTYTLGKMMLLKLRADYEGKMGAEYSLKDFHDRVLAAGQAPVKFIRREMMGKDDDEHMFDLVKRS